MPEFSKIRLFTHQFVPKTEIRNIQQVRDELTFIASFGEQKHQVPVYRETDDWFGYPMHYMQLHGKQVVDQRSQGEPLNLTFRRSVRPEQIPVLNSFREALQSGKEGFVIEAPPGWGKTAVMIHCILQINRTCVVVVPKSDIITQWIERLLYFTDIKRSEIGIVRRRNADWKGKKIIICLVKSLTLGYLGIDFKTYPGQVWYDEVHASTPPRTFAPVSCMFSARYRGGASATPDRVDGMHLVFEAHIQEVRFVGRDKNRLTADVLMVDYPKRSGDIPSWFRGMQRRGYLISLLAKNLDRNLELLKYIRLTWKSDRRQVILSDRIYQLKKLRLLLIQSGVPSSSIGLYIGNRSESQLAHIRDTCSIITATYKMLDMATDIPDLEALVYATPRSDPRQSKGRIERKLAGKKKPIVIDMCDPKYKETRRWEKERHRQYVKARCKIKRIY